MTREEYLNLKDGDIVFGFTLRTKETDHEVIHNEVLQFAVDRNSDLYGAVVARRMDNSLDHLYETDVLYDHTELFFTKEEALADRQKKLDRCLITWINQLIIKCEYPEVTELLETALLTLLTLASKRVGS